MNESGMACFELRGVRSPDGDFNRVGKQTQPDGSLALLKTRRNLSSASKFPSNGQAMFNNTLAVICVTRLAGLARSKRQASPIRLVQLHRDECNGCLTSSCK